MRRRFLVDRLPAAATGPETVIRQVYWRLGEGWTLRLRREGRPDEPPRDAVALRGPDDAGWEWPVPADPTSVAGLFKAGAGARVVKLRRAYGRSWTVEEYHWENDGLLVAETADPGPPPEWCGREITGEGAYEDESLAFRPFTTWR